MMTFIKKHSFVSLLGALFVFVAPFVTSRHLFYGATNGKFFFVLLFSYFFFLIFAYKLYTKERTISLKNQYLLFGIIAFCLVSVLSSLLGVHSTQSFWSDILRSTGTLFISHVALLAFSWSYLFRGEDWFLIRRALILSSSIFSVLYSLGLQGLGVFDGRFLSVNFAINGLSIGNETFAGAFVFLTLMLTLLEISRNRGGKRDQTLLYVFLFLQVCNPLMFNFNIFRGQEVTLFSWIGVARASAVVAWLSLVYFFSYRILRSFGTKTILKVFHIFIFLGIVATTCSLFIPGTLVREKYIELSTEARLITWNSAFEALEERPLLGYGPENFGYALQKSFNSGLYLQKNIGEVWFDRAHNAFVETLSTKGILGLMIALVVIGLMIRTLERAKQKGHIRTEERNLFIVLIIGHILQIFTSFDTIITHIVLASIVAYLLYLEREMEDEVKLSFPQTKIIAGFFVVVTLVSFSFVYVSERVRQNALFSIFVTEDFETIMGHIENLDTTKATFEPLRTGYSSLIKGVFENTESMKDPSIQKEVIAELALYDELLSRYVEKHPIDYRARMNLVYLRFAQTFLGENKLNDDTRKLILEGYELSPANPLTFVMDSLFTFYSGNVLGAETILKDAKQAFPEVELINDVMFYIEAQKKTLPKISFLKLENI